MKSKLLTMSTLALALTAWAATANATESSDYFPLDEVNPNIYAEGSYDAETHTLVTGTYGFGGWEFNPAIDLSSYNYIVFEFLRGTNIAGGADIRLFDHESYWTDCSSYVITAYRMVIDLTTMTTENGAAMDPSTIYRVGFWTFGGETNQVILNSVYLTNTYPTDDYTPPFDDEALTEITDSIHLTPLHVEGKYLVNEDGEVVNLHGFAQTFSPFFNESAWGNYDVDGCLYYNKKRMKEVLDAGWAMTFVRQHMDPYWCQQVGSESDTYLNINYDDFEKYLDLVYIPMAEYANARGLYVVMRPPGVCPETIEAGGEYNDYLMKIWDIVSSHPSIKNNPGIMFELANEPVNIIGTDGSVGGDQLPQFEAMSQFLQPIVNKIRDNGADNVIWMPGLGYQSWYYGFEQYPVEGTNLGFAVHCYPGWYGSDALGDSGEGLYDGTNGGYASFQRGWDEHMGTTCDKLPLMVTEMDWSDGYTWGQGYTGKAGGAGFGANFKYIMDNTGNVSYLIFTGQDALMQFVDEEPEDGNYTFYNNPEDCLWPCWHWYREYAGIDVPDHGSVTGLSACVLGQDYLDGDTIKVKTGDDCFVVLYATYSDGETIVVNTNAGYTVTVDNEDVFPMEKINKMNAIRDGNATVSISYEGFTLDLNVEVTSFPFDGINANIWGDGNTYDEETRTLVTEAYGFGGWEYSNGLDLSAYNYLVVEFCKGTNVTGGIDIRLFDQNSYWTDCASYTVNSYRMVIDLRHMTANGATVNPSHLYIIGFWTYGGESNRVVLNNVYVTNTYPTDEYVAPDEPTTGISATNASSEEKMTLYGGKAYIQGMEAGNIAYLYTTDGRLALTARATADGSACVDLSTLGHGTIYLLRTGSKTFKVCLND